MGLKTIANNKIEKLKQHTVIKVIWMWSVFVKMSYCTVLTLLVMMWDDKMPLQWDEVRWIIYWYVRGGWSSHGFLSRAENIGGWGIPGMMEQEKLISQHAAQRGIQFKAYMLLITEIFYLIFFTVVDCG